MNQITITGRLARDPEYSTMGTPRVNFVVAVDRRGAKDGDKVDWFRCVAWDGEKSKPATQISKFFAKGRGITIQGRMENDPYTDKEDRLRDSWAIKVEKWEFPISDPKGKKESPSAPVEKEEAPVEFDNFEAAEDDIPF